MTELPDIAKSLEGEAAVIGGMILEPHRIPSVADQLDSCAFYWDKHRITYEAIQDTYKGTEQKKFDMVLLRGELKKQGKLKEAGGIKYIAELVETIPSAATMDYYIKLVKDAHTVRQLLEYSLAIQVIATENVSVEEKLGMADLKLRDLTGDHPLDSTIQISESIKKFSTKDNTIYIPTGYIELDDIILGLGGGQMIVLAGRPSMGKTAFATNIATKFEYQGIPTAIISLEMPRSELQIRLISGMTQIDSRLILKDDLTSNQREEIEAAKKVIGKWRMIIDDTPGLTMDAIENKVWRFVREYRVGCVFIDYLQLINGDGKTYERVSNASRAIKTLARKTEIPIVILSQLNRAVESRDDKRPRPSDLRDSGSIEQDADVIMMLYRADHYNHTNNGIAELIINKQRNGDTGSIELMYIKETTTFKTMPTPETGLF